jgi:sulfoxide reductase heme-binding subunit YedZ
MRETILTVLNSKYFLWLLLAWPAIQATNGYLTGDLFYGEMVHLTGEYSARLLILTMAITPLRLFFNNAKWPTWLLHRRRYLGVATFAYAALHTLVYLNHKRDAVLIMQEAAEFSMWTGWVALPIFLALAVTSNDAAVKRLQRGWKKLHRWVYVAALLTFMHWIFVAFYFVPGLLHFLLLVSLESYRVWKRRALKRVAIGNGAN